MLTFPKESPWLREGPTDLVSRAGEILAREAQGLPGYAAQTPGAVALPTGVLTDLTGRACPVVGATVPARPVDKDGLRQQAHELMAGLFGAFGQASPGGYDLGNLQRQAHEFIETLLSSFGSSFALPTYAQGASAEDRVPHLQCLAPVQAGTDAHATFTVANEEPNPSQVTLYTTNFVADSGYDIPCVRVSASPRVVTIPPGGRKTFEIKIEVPQQAPAGTYSGLIQAIGTKYVKAVLSVEVS